MFRTVFPRRGITPCHTLVVILLPWLGFVVVVVFVVFVVVVVVVVVVVA